MSSDKLTIILLRHGETVYNIEKRLQSPKDHLNEQGISQIKELKEELSKFNFDHVISSDEKRASESAEIICSWANKDFKQTPLIREKSSGDFSDKLVKDVDWSTVQGPFLEKKIPGGENVQEVMVRALEFFRDLNKFKQGETILVVSHGAFLRVLLGLIFHNNIQDYLLNYEFPNATYSIISRSSDGMWNSEKSNLVKKNG
ncbi:MAG: histidine phosphatase family protein [Nanoarchaeota archaeon]|nr:histidine phosphatase family protein [Nanoarchaeota archaeon]